MLDGWKIVVNPYLRHTEVRTIERGSMMIMGLTHLCVLPHVYEPGMCGGEALLNTYIDLERETIEVERELDADEERIVRGLLAPVAAEKAAEARRA